MQKTALPHQQLVPRQDLCRNAFWQNPFWQNPHPQCRFSYELRCGRLLCLTPSPGWILEIRRILKQENVKLKQHLSNSEICTTSKSSKRCPQLKCQSTRSNKANVDWKLAFSRFSGVASYFSRKDPHPTAIFSSSSLVSWKFKQHPTLYIFTWGWLKTGVASHFPASASENFQESKSVLGTASAWKSKS